MSFICVNKYENLPFDPLPYHDYNKNPPLTSVVEDIETWWKLHHMTVNYQSTVTTMLLLGTSNALAAKLTACSLENEMFETRSLLLKTHQVLAQNASKLGIFLEVLGSANEYAGTLIANAERENDESPVIRTIQEQQCKIAILMSDVSVANDVYIQHLTLFKTSLETLSCRLDHHKKLPPPRSFSTGAVYDPTSRRRNSSDSHSDQSAVTIDSQTHLTVPIVKEGGCCYPWNQNK